MLKISDFASIKVNEACKKQIALNKQHINTVKTRQVWDRMVSFHLAVTSPTCLGLEITSFMDEEGRRRQHLPLRLSSDNICSQSPVHTHFISTTHFQHTVVHIVKNFPYLFKEPQNQASFTLPRSLIKLNLFHLTLWLWQQRVWFCKTVLSSGCCPGVKIKVCFLVKGHSYYVQPHTGEDYLHSCCQTAGETKKKTVIFPQLSLKLFSYMVYLAVFFTLTATNLRAAWALQWEAEKL